MKFLSIAIKDLKEILRDRRGFLFILLFPILFMVVFGFAFGGMGGNTPYNLAIINYDQGSTLPDGSSVNFGNNLTQDLKDIKYQNSSVHIFNVTTPTESNANQSLKQRKLDAALIIPPNFSDGVVGLINNTILTSTTPLAAIEPGTAPNVTANLIIRGDTGFLNFGVSQGILVGILSQYQNEIVTQTQNNITGTPGAQPTQFLNNTVQPLAGTSNFSTFDFLAPGMIVFAILLLATTVAASMTREAERGTLRRLKLTKMRAFDLLFGGLLPWTLVVAAQVVILFIVAIAIGFHWQGGINSIVLAIIVGLIGGVASVSLGMIIAAFAKNDRQAANLGTLIVVPASFLVGAFFQLPQVVIANIGGQAINFNDLLPWTHVLNALRATLTYGEGWNDISSQVLWAAVLTVIFFIIGVILYSRTRLRPES